MINDKFRSNMIVSFSDEAIGRFINSKLMNYFDLKKIVRFLLWFTALEHSTSFITF